MKMDSRAYQTSPPPLVYTTGDTYRLPGGEFLAHLEAQRTQVSGSYQCHPR